MKRHPGLLVSVRRRVSRDSRRALRGAFGLWAWYAARDLRSASRRGRETGGQRSRKHVRRGSTLLVVIALLGMLLLLGMLCFTFATQEQQSATNFAEAAKLVDDPGDDIDAIFESVLEQVVQGPSYEKKNSALWGGRHSIAFTMLGQDLQPFNGVGVNLHRTASGTLVVDQNRDGVADGDQSLLELNDSPAARNVWPPVERRVETLPAPDVDYTNPDNNNAFLAYIGKTWKTPAGAAATGYTVIKPSFHRPELLRDNNGNPITDWATHTGAGTAPFSTAGRLFRPHPSHLYVPRSDQNITAPIRRFLNDYDPADAGDISSLSAWFAPNAPRGFPFKKVPPLPAPVPATVPDREQGVWSLTGLPPNPPFTFPAHDFDVDNDNDGTPDSIWMDLDLPAMVRPSDNSTYIPLVALLIQDLDSLLNLNATGNLSGDTQMAATTDFGNGADVSRSSMGLSPSEINPLWALDTQPSEAASLSDHGSYFHAPTTIRHLANMEWWWFNKGRVEYSKSPPQIHAGRFGEANRIWGVLNTAGGGKAIGVQMSQSNLFPFPGIWDVDDNRDSNEGGATSTAGTVGGQSLPFRHPLALNGMGQFWLGTNPKQLNLFQALGGTDPNRWLRYSGVGIGYDGNTFGTGNVGWLTPFGGSLMVNPIVGVNFAVPGGTPVLLDDPNELTLDSKYLQRPYDEPLEAKDILFLFMSPSDRTKVGATSRFQDLMPGNITPTGSSSFYQLEVARRLTSESWDVKQFALPRFVGGVGTDNLPGVANKDDNGDGVMDDENERGWPGSDDDRAWEYNVDLDGNGKLQFPPQFNPPANFQPSQPENAYGAIDPFRPQLRRLLTVEFGNTTTARSPMRLSINEFLDVEHRVSGVSNPYTDPLAYRPLTPHSTDSTLTTLPAVSPLPAYPPTNEGQKEFWARRDRQQMARDIYVLLYTFCGGNDSVNLATTDGNTAYHGKIRRQMAQFAVNMVDAMDRDNVITAFEYDDNLADGWNLDDDFMTNDSGTLPATSRRFVVFGVEAQELTISEALWAFQAQNGTDAPLTPFNEPAGNHHFLQVELRCVSPTAVDLYDAGSTALNRAIWRILRDDNGNGVMDGTAPNQENAAQFLKGTFVPAGLGPAAAPPSSLSPGSLFTFASADASPVGAASLYVDTAATAGFELAAPNLAGSYPSTPGFADLDMNHSSHSSYVGLEQPGSVAGDLFSRNFEPAATTTATTIRLERRLNPKLIGLNQAANPFHSVDQFRVQKQDLNIVAADTNATATTKLSALSSQERDQPLNGGSAADSTTAAPAVLKSTLTLKNSNSPAMFNLFQPHFDRDFASVIELFDIPLEGPDRLTRILVNARRPPNLVDSSGTGIGQLENRGPFTFGAAALMQSEDRDSNGMLLSTTDDADNNGIQNGTETDTNGNGFFDFGEDFNKNGNLDAHPYHFHRLLSLVEVPTRTHRQLGDPLKVNRVPGKINLNGVRDPRVLASLIDDRQVIGPPERTGVDLDGDGTIEYGLQDLLGDTVLQDAAGTTSPRDWWFQFLIARDGLDPTTSLPLPISGTSHPFRDTGYLRYDQEFGVKASIEDTILRGLPGAIKYTAGSGVVGPSDGRRLFELATKTEFENRSLEPKMRNRLLSKIIGNTTTRSNVFVVHATIGMFACKEYSDGSVRIGGQMDVDRDGSPDTHRAVFIVDRSAVEEAYDKGSGTFDWKKLLLAKQRIN